MPTSNTILVTFRPWNSFQTLPSESLVVKDGRNPSSGDNYDKKRENNKKRERLVVKCGGKVGNYIGQAK